MDEPGVSYPTGREALSVNALAVAARKSLRRFPPLDLVPFLLVALWLCRRFIGSTSIPAGTDLLGFVTRARQNGSLGVLVSPWSPSSLGAIRQVTLDNLLGAITLVTGDALVTVKLVVVATLFGAAWGTYALSREWYGSRSAAIAAGILYMTSQASLTRWGSGELNVELVVAAAPFVILLWGRCLRGVSLRRAVILTLAVNVVLFVRIDMLAYILPFLALQTATALCLSRQPRRVAANATAAASFAVISSIGLLSYQLVPLAHGLRAHWLTSASLFDPLEFQQRSIALFPSLLGFGREIGYFAFSGEQTWFSHPWVPTPVYEVAAATGVLVALSAFVWYRGRRSVFLGASFVAGVFLAKGIRGPVPGPYLWAVHHIPAFGNLRDPNRWLIVPSAAIAVLAGLALCRAASVTAKHLRGAVRRPVLVAAIATLAGLLFLPVGPSLARGFLTWHVTGSQRQLLNRIGQDRSAFTVASVPYDQTYRFLRQGGYQGYEHDLGAESAAFTGHPVLADGGWNQRAADFVAYTSGLLTSGDDAFARLLGTVGVKYLLELSYPATAPHLLPAGLASKHHDPWVGTLRQQQALARMTTPRTVTRNGAGAVLALPRWSPQLSLRTNAAVVVGGSAGLASFADLHGIHLDRWNAVTTDDLLQTGGLSAVLHALRSADSIVLGNDAIPGIAALATQPLVAQAGATSTPALDRLTELLPSDLSVRVGAAHDESVPPATPFLTRQTSTFSVPRALQVELWAHLQFGPTAAEIRFSIDGRAVARVTPLSLTPLGMRWNRVARIVLGPGDHTLTTEALPSTFGSSYEVQARAIPGAARSRIERQLEAVIAKRANRIVVGLDLQSLPLGAGSHGLYRRATEVAAPGRPFWSPLLSGSNGGTPAQRALTLQLDGGRPLYTVAQHVFAAPRDWSERDFLFLTYRASPRLGGTRLLVDFDRRHRRSASFELPPATGWTTVALNMTQPRATPTATARDWSHVVSLRVATDSREASGELSVGAVALSPRARAVEFTYAVPCDLPKSSVQAPPGILARLGRCTLSLAVPRKLLGRPTRVVVRPPDIPERPPVRPLFVQTGPTSYAWSVDAPDGGTLVLARGYDQHWTLSSGGSKTKAAPAFSVVNGFPIGKGAHEGTITFAGAAAVSQGIAVSGATLAGLLVLGIWPASRRRIRIRSSKRHDRRRRERLRALESKRRTPSFWTAVAAAVALGLILPASPPLGCVAALLVLVVYRVSWRSLLMTAAAVAVSAPAVALVSPAAADVAALETIGLLAAGLVLMATEQRRRRT